MKAHFIAIGGSAMHNLAIALHKKGIEVTGSDDEIFEPAKSHLEKYGLLPKNNGWNPALINDSIDAVILGMHAREDNPELLRARELNLKVFSYPEYVYEQTRDKTRVVIGGSHGKTTITSMIMHVLQANKVLFDYLVGAPLEGFETMVGLSLEAKIAVFEGDEYLASALDPRPKFHLYKPHIAVISGIAWDHINVFPTFENYLKQFRVFAELVPSSGALIYYQEDENLQEIARQLKSGIELIPYKTHQYETNDNKTVLLTKDRKVPVLVFGEHNLQNISAAKAVCKQLGLTDQQFYDAIKTFKGAAKRLQLLGENADTAVYLDFAHSPSKLKATTSAVKKQYPGRQLVACMELHTFSSLNEAFLEQYKGSMIDADYAFVYFNPETIEHKRLAPLTIEMVRESFGGSNLEVFTDSNQLVNRLLELNWKNKNLLLMSSGNFSGIDFAGFTKKVLGI
jgi:UDP-N-acetylmuramate: L-alanyl-gamma-D-glutamyl-meso-diaminopimelate ligase